MTDCASPVNGYYGNVITAGQNSTISQIDFVLRSYSGSIVNSSLQVKVSTGSPAYSGGTVVETFNQNSVSASTSDGGSYYLVSFTGSASVTAGTDYYLQVSYTGTDRGYSLCLSGNTPTYTNSWTIKMSSTQYKLVFSSGTGTFNWSTYHKFQVWTGAVASNPTVTSLNTTSGTTLGGTSVTITGTNLSNVTGITFGGTAGTSISSNTSTSVTVVTPAKAAGAVDVVVTTAAGSVTSSGAFTYVAPPTISAVTIAGTPNIGQTLTASATLGGGTPTSTTYQWQSADSASGSYSNISGATSSTYVVANTQVGKYIKVSVSASNNSGSATLASSATTLVNDGLFLNFNAGNSSSYSGTGTSVTDLSGSGYGGTLSGGVGFVSTYGKSFSFSSASSQFIDVADIPAISFANGFSATVWANFGGSATNNYERVFDFGNGNENNNFLFGREGTGNTLFLEVWNGSTSAGVCRASGGIQTGWAHYAVTINGSTCTFYVNGTALTSGVSGTTAAPNSIARTLNYIGRSNWAADKYFESGIGRISMWNRALSDSEIAARATAETPANLSLSASSISVTRGSAITTLTATLNQGTATSYSISPTLPAGLSLNSATGAVSGTPTVGLASTTYTITANGISPSATATFTLAVSASALTNASAPSVSATSGSTTSLTVTFTSVSNASSHTVRLYQTDGTSLISTNTGFTSGGTLTGLTANTNYKVSLQAIGDGLSYSTSSESTKTSATTANSAVSPVFSTHPSNTTASVGNTATFYSGSSVSDGGTRSYQWQTSTDGTTWSNVGSNLASYTTGTLSYSNNGLLVRIIVTNTINGTTASTTSNTATLTVNLISLSAPAIYSFGTGTASTSSATLTFGAVANASSYTARVYLNDGTTLVGTPYTNFTSGGQLTGLSPTTTYKISIQAIGNGTVYGSSAESSKVTVTTNAAAVAPVISVQPQSRNKEAGSTATFSVTATVTDFGTLSYQWQTSSDGSTWTNVGTNSNSFTTGNLTNSDAGLDVRVVVTNTKYGTTSTVTSNSATISIVTYTALMTTQSETVTNADAWIVRSNVRYAHQFNAGGSATINLVKTKISATQNYPSQVKIVIYADSSDTVGSKLGELLYDSTTSLNASYTGSVSIPSSGKYWIEIQPTAEIANHYYGGTSSTASTGSASGWSQQRGKVASGSNSSTWTYFVGTPYTYPSFYIGGIGSIISGGSVSGISPSSGPIGGGTVVTITGTVLENTTGVTFGGVSGTSLTVNGATSITVTTPVGSAGAVDVVVTTSTKVITSQGGFTYFGLPVIASASISGIANSGQSLTAVAGNLSGGPVSSTTYKWQVSDSANGTYSDISGATSSTYTLTSSEINKYVRVVITVSNVVGNASATSTPSAQIAAPLTAPTLTGAAISGTTTQGQVLTASIQGAGGGTATTTTYQWSRADSAGGSYSNISNATNSTYTLTSADVAKYIKVTISVSNSAGGPNSATSSASNQIAPIAPTLVGASFIGTTTVGQTLTATTGTTGGGPVTSTTYQWKSSSTASGIYTDISGATGSTYVLTSNEANKYIKVTVTVSNVAGSNSATSNASAAAVISNNPTPTVSSISPNAGTTAGGTSVTISGTNLSTVSSVTFDGSAATISTKTSTQLVVVTPAHSAGAVDVVVTNPAGSITSANGFTYATTPTVRSWTATPSITSGNVNDTFTVTYQAVCTTPQRYGPSMYDLIYVTPGVWTYNSYMGSGTSNDGGYTWTITKTYTLTGSGIWKVDAYERGACWDSYNFTYATRSLINVGVAGPTITSLNVTSGPSTGGTSTTITGTNLTGVTGITVGSTAATSIRSNTATSVTFNTPAGTAGAKNVVVTTQAGTATATNAFTYTAPITITYDVNGGSGSPSRTSDSYTPNTGGYSLPVIGTMTRTGHTFSGWATANNSTTAITSPYNPTSSLTVYAIWTAISYTNSYNANGATGGSVPSSTTDSFGSTVTVAGNTGSLARTGYTLAGWNTAANGLGTSYTLGSGTFTQSAGNQILYAEWIADTYTVSYDVNGSADSVPASHTNRTANSTITLAAAVTRANFAFVGWEESGITYKAGASYTLAASDVTLVAKWIAVFKLSYNLNGTGAIGNVPADFQYASGDPVTVTNVLPTRTGYNFGGWIDQSGVSRASSSTYNISSSNYLLYAVWTPIPYSVTYAINGGQGSAPTETSKNINNTFTVASAPTKTGSTFSGWSDGTRNYGAGSTYLVGTSNITLTAQWTLNSYAITYDLAQGTSSVPSGLNKNFQDSWNLPAAPTRVGYNFVDWYDGTTGYAAEASYTLNSATDLTITARWTAIVYYTVTYDLDGGLGTPPSQDPLQNGQSFTLATDPNKTGFSFTGWSYAGTTYSSGQTITMPAANVTVTALWTATSAGTYAITYISNGAQTSAPTVPALAENATFTIDDGSVLIKNGYIFSGWSRNGTTYNGGETFTMPASAVTFSAIWVPSIRATAVTHSVDATSITRGRSITVTYSLGCYAFSSTIPTIFENVSTTGESFINDITSALTIIDAGYNWTVTRVYTLSRTGTYTIFATASGGCFSASTDSTSSTVTVTEPPSNASGGGSTGGNATPTEATRPTAVQTGSVQPVTVVGARIALVANKNYTLPKINNTTPLSVEAKTGASATSTSTTTQSNGSTLTSTTMLSVNNASKGLSQVKIVENQLAVVPTVGFSGKTDVTVTVTDGATTTTVVVPVTVLPEPVKDPVITPVAARQTTVTWEPSPNADSYQVIVDGKTACKAATDSCDVKKILGPNADVQVIANGGDATKSDAVDADYEAKNAVVITKLVGTTTGGKLTANDINMLDKVIATVKAQGFETVTISQITTTKVNSAAAKARVDALVNYVKSKSGDPDLVVKVVPPPTKTSMNQIGVK